MWYSTTSVVCRLSITSCCLHRRQAQDVLAEQLSQLDKRNSMLANMEREMVTMRKSYETAVETRNYTGLALVDRNDELCILYDKAHT